MGPEGRTSEKRMPHESGLVVAQEQSALHDSGSTRPKRRGSRSTVDVKPECNLNCRFGMTAIAWSRFRDETREEAEGVFGENCL